VTLQGRGTYPTTLKTATMGQIPRSTERIVLSHLMAVLHFYGKVEVVHFTNIKCRPIHKFNRRNNFSNLIGCVFSDVINV